MAEEQLKTVAKNKLTDADQEKVDQLMENGEETQLDETGVKKTILLFEKKALKNQETRIKFPDQPEKFMESEMELHDAIQEMHNIATVPDHYPILVDLNCIASMLGLLCHDNSDISVAVLDLMQELTDVDTMNESE